jgi:hypothetical protein
MASWMPCRAELPCGESPQVPFPARREAPSWPAKRDGSRSQRPSMTASSRSPTPGSPPRDSPSAHDSSRAVPNRTSPPTSRSPKNSAVTPTPSPVGETASPHSACKAYEISRGVVARGLFPPEERHQVLVLATTEPAGVGVSPTGRWRTWPSRSSRTTATATGVAVPPNASWPRPTSSPTSAAPGRTATIPSSSRRRWTSASSTWTPRGCTGTASWSYAATRRPASRLWNASARPSRRRRGGRRRASSSTSAPARAACWRRSWCRPGWSTAT